MDSSTMDRWLKYGFCKKTEITSNAETSETKASIEDTEIAEAVQPPTSIVINPQKTKSASSDSVQPSMKKRKYDPNYFSYGFTDIGDEEPPDDLCLLCNKI